MDAAFRVRADRVVQQAPLGKRLDAQAELQTGMPRPIPRTWLMTAPALVLGSTMLSQNPAVGTALTSIGVMAKLGQKGL
jgi:hypothetical protein